VNEAIRLFIGSSPNGEDYEADAVAAWTAKKHCSLPLEIVFMRQAKKGPYSGWKCASGITPFSHFRWSPPAMCNFDGRAIYTDADFIFMSDLAELWRMPMNRVIRTKRDKDSDKGKLRTGCILFDCAKAKGHVPTLDQLRSMPDPHGTVEKYFKGNQPALVENYGCGEWNVRDPTTHDLIYSPDTKAIHYTRMEHQLHLGHAAARLKAQGKTHWYKGQVFRHPSSELQKLFDGLLIEAIDHGYTFDSFKYGSDVSIERRGFTYSVHQGR
jgi:hypothetical protein